MPYHCRTGALSLLNKCTIIVRGALSFLDCCIYIVAGALLKDLLVNHSLRGQPHHHSMLNMINRRQSYEIGTR